MILFIFEIEKSVTTQEVLPLETQWYSQRNTRIYGLYCCLIWVKFQ